MRPRMFVIPDGPALELSLAPRLESWDARGHPSQVALRAFVAHVHELIDPVISRTPGELAFRLDVGLPDTVDPLWERDLDNYLFPIARSLPERVTSVWGTKRRHPQSFVRVERATERLSPAGWDVYDVPPSRASERYWKAAVRRAVSNAQQLPPGPVGLQLAFSVGPNRNWPALWKESLDGLEPLLGKTYEDRDWNPQDGRVVRLGLHRSHDRSLEADAAMAVWARIADDGWPELAWLADLDREARDAFLSTPSRRPTKPRAARAPAVPSVERPVRQGAITQVPVEPIEGVKIFRDDDSGYVAWIAAHAPGFVVNIQRSGNPSDARFHRATCRTVSGSNPRGGPWTGAYIKACADSSAHLDSWAASTIGRPITRCRICHPPPAPSS